MVFNECILYARYSGKAFHHPCIRWNPLTLYRHQHFFYRESTRWAAVTPKTPTSSASISWGLTCPSCSSCSWRRRWWRWRRFLVAISVNKFKQYQEKDFVLAHGFHLRNFTALFLLLQFFFISKTRIFDMIFDLICLFSFISNQSFSIDIPYSRCWL